MRYCEGCGGTLAHDDTDEILWEELGEGGNVSMMNTIHCWDTVGGAWGGGGMSQ